MKIYLGIIFIVTYGFLFADSPLTSTNFSEVYKQERIIEYTQKRHGKIDRKITRFISSNKTSLELKLACINALSWNIDNQSNAPILLNSYFKKYRCKDLKVFLNKGNAKDLICYAYLLSLDNYHDVEKAKIISQSAVERDPNSYAIQIINSLIQAQFLFDSDWCGVYTVCNNVRTNSKLNDDFSLKAKEIIFDYMDLYESYCK